MERFRPELLSAYIATAEAGGGGGEGLGAGFRRRGGEDDGGGGAVERVGTAICGARRCFSKKFWLTAWFDLGLYLNKMSPILVYKQPVDEFKAL